MREKFCNAARVLPAGLALGLLALMPYACAVDNNGGNAPGFDVGSAGTPAGFGGSAGALVAGAGGASGAGTATGTAGMNGASASGRAAGVGGAGTLGVSGSSGGAMTAGRGAAGSAGTSGHGGASGAGGQAGQAGGGAGAGGTMSMDGETGRMVGMTAAHNAVRAMVTTQPPLPPLTWSPTLAAYAQAWADSEAMTECAFAQHRSGAMLAQVKYGENLAEVGSTQRGGPMTTPQDAVKGWAGEVACWTYGTITDPVRGGGTEKCNESCYMTMMSDGCGHYTQIVWRDTKQVGCGVATCTSGMYTYDIWICNYSPPGNLIGTAPY